MLVVCAVVLILLLVFIVCCCYVVICDAYRIRVDSGVNGTLGQAELFNADVLRMEGINLKNGYHTIVEQIGILTRRSRVAREARALTTNRMLTISLNST